MSVTQTLRAVEILRSLGVTVTFEPGWETRGNGQSSAYQGGIIHHTGGAYNDTCPWILVGGRSDLAGPLCNFAGLANGVIHVVAAHPANHAGASGGPSNGPFPRTSLFNRLVMGLEICYPGSQPMTDAQYRSAKAFAKTMQVMNGDIERARAHRETSIEGKWDPGYAPGLTINMADLRSEAANQEEDDLNAEESEWLGETHGKVLTHHALPDGSDSDDMLGHILITTQRVRDLAENGVPTRVELTDEDRAAIVADLAKLVPSVDSIAAAVVAEFKKEGN